jgi:hypothetical protein
LALVSPEKEQKEQKEQEQQQLKQNNNKKGFFVIKRKSKYNLWMPVALYDEENHYRVAVFEDFYQAIQYQKKYEDRLIKQYLKERKRGYENNNKRPNYNRGEVKLFIEHEMPNIRNYF